MAKCIGCGLEVNNGILEVSLKTDGGIVCDPTTKELRVQFPANQQGGSSLLPIGCGLETDATGRIQVSYCDKGGILCGATDDDAQDQCIYVNVQNQGGAACKDLGTVRAVGGTGGTLGTNCTPNGCNGLVRTCDGLWAPPKLPECSGIASETIGAANFADILHPKTSMDGQFPGSHGGVNEWALAASPGTIIAEWCCCVPTGYEASCVRMTGNTFTNGTTPIVLVAPGQVVRFTVWERLIYAPTGSNCGDISKFATTAWVLQNQILFDEFGPGKSSGYSSAFIDSSWVIMDIPGQCLAGQMMVTVQRFPSTNGVRPNNQLSGNFAMKREYLHTLHGAHCSAHDFTDFRAAQP